MAGNFFTENFTIYQFGPIRSFPISSRFNDTWQALSEFQEQ